MATIGKSVKVQIIGESGEWVDIGESAPLIETSERIEFEIHSGFEIDVEVETDRDLVAAANAASAVATNNADWWNEFMSALAEQGEGEDDV